MTRGALVAAVGFGLAGMLAESGFAATPDVQIARLDPRKVMEQSEQAIGRNMGNYKLINSTGTQLSLRDYRGKPLVISLVYTACSSVCPPTTQHLISAVSEAGRIFGLDSFNVLTVGFDARNDTPGRMAQFALIQGVKIKNWRLASADPGPSKRCCMILVSVMFRSPVASITLRKRRSSIVTVRFIGQCMGRTFHCKCSLSR